MSKATTISKDEFLVNFSTKHIIDGLSPFRKKWSIIVLMEINQEKTSTFHNIQQKFLLSPSMLSSTLKELASEKLISRKVYGQDFPLRIEYRTTLHGRKMIKALESLIEVIYTSKK